MSLGCGDGTLIRSVSTSLGTFRLSLFAAIFDFGDKCHFEASLPAYGAAEVL